MDATRQPRSEAGRSRLAAVLLLVMSVTAMALLTSHEAAATTARAADVATMLTGDHHVAVDAATGRVRLVATAAVGAHREPRTRSAPAGHAVAATTTLARSDRFVVVDVDPAVLPSPVADIATSPRAPPTTTPSLSH